MTLPAHASILTGRIPVRPRRQDQRHLPVGRRCADAGHRAGGRGLPERRVRRRVRARRALRTVPRLRRSTTTVTRRAGDPRSPLPSAAPPTSSRPPETGSSRRRRTRPLARVGPPLRSPRALRRADRVPRGTRALRRGGGLYRRDDRAPPRSAACRARARPHADRRHRRPRRVARRSRRDDARAVRLRRDAGGAARSLSGTGVGRGVVEGTAGHADLLPTICDLLGIAPPATLDGSLARAARRSRTGWCTSRRSTPRMTRGWAPLTGRRLRALEVHRPAGAGAVRPRRRSGRSPQPGGPATRAREGDVRREGRDGGAGCVTRRARVRPPRPMTRLRAACVRSATSRRAPSAARRRGRRASPSAAADDPKRLVELNERFNTALSAFNAGQSDAALAGFRAVLAERPDFLTARTSAATVLIATGRARDAVALLRRGPRRPGRLAGPAGQAWRRAPRGGRPGRGRASPGTRAGRRRAGIPSWPTISASSTRGWDARAKPASLFEELLRRDPGRCVDVEQSRRAGALHRAAARGRPGVPPGRGGRTRHAAMRGRGSAPRSSTAIGRPPSTRGGGPSACCRTTTICSSTWAMVLADGPSPREALPYLERFVREAPRDRYARRHRARRSRDPTGAAVRPCARALPRAERRARRPAPSGLHASRSRACHRAGRPPPRPCRAPTCCWSPSTRCGPTVSAPTAAPPGVTPTLDRLAAEGLRVDTVYATSPLTLPSHAAMMTGAYPHVNGVRDNGSFRFDGKRADARRAR